MTRKQYLKNMLIFGLFTISLGGWLLHLRIHPPMHELADRIPFTAGIISIAAVPIMFFFHKTVQYAYVINGMLVIIGTITMAHYSIVHLPEEPGLSSLFLNTTFPDIAILWTKFAIGKSLFELEYTDLSAEIKQSGRFFRYPNMGWWLVHLAGMALVYFLGNILWK